MEKQNRFKSMVMWAAIVAQILAILVALGVVTPEISEQMRTVAISVLEILTAFGVLNNPTDPSHL